MQAFLSKTFTSPPSGDSSAAAAQEPTSCFVTRTWVHFHSSFGKSAHRVKLACILVLLGLVMLIMGCIVHIEKSAIQVDYKNTNYMYIAANALLALGAIFVLLSFCQMCCCCADSCFARDDAERGDAATNSSRERTACNVIAVDPPKYCDVIKLDDVLPPSYFEVVETEKEVPPCDPAPGL